MATLTSPFTGDQLKSAIGASGYDADSYFTGEDGNINPYSPCKPVRSSSKGESGESLCALKNYGFDTTYLMAYGVNDVFTYAKNPNYRDWTSLYRKPRGASYSEYLRWDDFNGYEKNAVAPFGYSQLPTSTNSTSLSLRFVRQSPSMDISQMGVIIENGGAGNWRWAVAYRKSGTTAASFAYGGYVGSNTSSDVYVDINFPSTGTYECVFMAARGGDGAPMLWMPSGYFTVTISALSTPVIVSMTSNHYPYVSGDYIMGFNNTMSFSMVAENASVSQSSGAVSLNIIGFTSSGSERVNFTITDYNNTLSYSGTATRSQTIDWNAGNVINVLQYVDSGDWEKVTDIDIYLSVDRYSGSATWSTDMIYSWQLSK